jgi:AraC family transcriptional regulator
MVTTTVLRSGSISVIDYRCDAGPSDKPFVEQHGSFSISYVRKGTFGYRSRGASYELVAGSSLVAHIGDEFICVHDHVVGDECLSFQLSPELIDAIGSRARDLARRPRATAARPDGMGRARAGRRRG